MRDREREMTEEMRLHLEHRVEQKIAAGLSPADARAAALREFGNVESLKLQSRQQRHTWRLATVLRDVRFGLRLLRRSPGFAVTAIVTLALGVGANVAVFSVLRGVLIEKPAYPDPDRVVHVWRDVERLPRGHSLSSDDLALIRANTTAMLLLAGAEQRMATVRGDAPPERTYVAQVQLDYFAAYGVAAATGRWFGAGDFEAAARPAVISDALWRRQFAARTDVLGKVVHIDDTAFTVVGVMPPGFVAEPASSIEADAWTPMLLGSEQRLVARTVARLHPNVTAPDAAMLLSAILPPRNVELENGPILRHLGVRVEPVGRVEAEAVRPGVMLLQGAALLLVLIMCANLGNVFLAHATERRRELGVRVALGAGRARLIGQLLTEAAVIATIGGGIALGIAASVVPGLQALAGNLLPRTASIAVTMPELLAALALSWATTLAFAGIPAWLISRADPLEAFRGSTTATATAGARAFRASLISVQVLLALVMLVGSGLLIRSFARVFAQPLGFEPRGLVTGRVEIQPKTTQWRDETLAFAHRLDEELRTRIPPGAFTIGGDVPYSSQSNAPFKLIPAAGGAPLRDGDAYIREIAPHALEFFGIRLIRGRGFEESDDRSAPPVALVNEAFVRRFAPGHEVIGATLDRGLGPDWPSPTIVGVVADVRWAALTRQVTEAVYLPFLQSPSTMLFVATRGVGRNDAARTMREAVRALDPNLPVTEIGAVEDRIRLREQRRAFYLSMLSTFALIAIALAAVGIYGVVAHVTARRGREMGIRLALGAQPRGLVRMVVRQSLLPIGLGLVFGLVSAWWLTLALQSNPVFKSQLFEVSADDPATFTAVSVLLLGVALIACWIPARRAATARVTEVLKAE